MPRQTWLIILIALITVSPTAFAWPTDPQWLPVYRGGQLLYDSNSDANGSRNVVGDSANPSAYIYNDGSYFYFRMRLDSSPAGSGGQGLLQAFGWGMVLDTNLNAINYEWLIMVDGIDKNEAILLEQNTIQGSINDPGDKAETLAYSLPLSGNYRVIAASTSFNGDLDYFLDWRFPYDLFKNYTQLTDSSPLRVFGGASSNAQALSESGGDLLGASDLLSGFSDFITPLGTRPTTGTVQFVANLTGTGDVTLFNIGDTLFIKVTDTDQNFNLTSPNTVRISLTSLNGDYETLTLTETGPNTGIFTGAIATTSSPAITLNDNAIQISTATTITATYLDAIDANLLSNQARTDNVSNAAPMLVLAKQADPASAPPGSEITYAITYRNIGGAAAMTTVVIDSIPLHTSYLPASLRHGAAGIAYASAIPLSDASDSDAGSVSNDTIMFTIPVVAANDSIDGSGADEGVLFFKVRID